MTTLSPDGRSRAPHLKTWRDGWRHLRFLLVHSPRWLFLYPGLFLVAFGVVLGALLAAGPLQLNPDVRLDIHSLIVACFAVLIGVQLVVFSALARSYASVEGFLPPPLTFGGAMRGLTLERLLQLAGVLVAAGLGGLIWAVSYWASLNFGDIGYELVLRVLVISLTTVATGVQLAAGGFLASVLMTRR